MIWVLSTFLFEIPSRPMLGPDLRDHPLLIRVEKNFAIYRFRRRGFRRSAPEHLRWWNRRLADA